ncbi:cysteine-rich receptor-like protein kinase 25 [Elaeis guineensis]|uniref:cysteine-rich receptor-like protein kinase 25 n=1 Tax=Elaeis guineensis var. tenera TaxID=51953 RepID=UPI003C6CDC09
MNKSMYRTATCHRITNNVSLPSSSSLFLPCFLFFLVRSPPIATNEPLYQLCGDSNYTANSTYKTNLDILLPSLSSNAALAGGFSNVSFRQKPTVAYSFALCRGDVNISLCLSCLDIASHEIVRLCLYKIEAVVWYDPYVPPPLLQPVLVDELLSALTDWPTKRFATGEVNFTTNFPTMYSMVVPSGFVQVDTDEVSLRTGGRVSEKRCNYRFEVYKLYDGIHEKAWLADIGAGASGASTSKSRSGNYDQLLLELGELVMIIPV